MYIPLIPRLKVFLANLQMAQRMLYRSVHQHDPCHMKDYMDGSHYQHLLSTSVTLNGKKQSYNHFSDRRSVALGFSMDEFTLFKWRVKSAWPMILYNYNLPPELRFLKDFILLLGLVPGHPIDCDSFIYPMVQELLQLEEGMLTWDAVSEEYFVLRAFLIIIFGDIPAISMLMRMKGHNGLCPCRFCNIQGVRIPGQDNSPYYPALFRANHPDVQVPGSTLIPEYNPHSLPMRTHEQFMTQAHEVLAAPNKTRRNKIATKYGIKGVPLLSLLSSVSFPESFPYDFMHLIWENLVKNLVLLWSGNFKGLSQGTGNYVIPKALWKQVGQEGVASRSTIPSAFGPAVPDIADDKMSWTADSRSQWTLFVAPVVLNGRLHDRYFRHFIKLVKLLQTCIQFEYTAVDRELIRNGFESWVKDYEM